MAADGDPAGGRDDDAADGRDERGLAGAVRAEEREDLALGDVEADAPERLEAGGVDLAKVLDRDHCRHLRSSTSGRQRTGWAVAPGTTRVGGGRQFRLPGIATAARSLAAVEQRSGRAERGCPAKRQHGPTLRRPSRPVVRLRPQSGRPRRSAGALVLWRRGRARPPDAGDPGRGGGGGAGRRAAGARLRGVQRRLEDRGEAARPRPGGGDRRGLVRGAAGAGAGAARGALRRALLPAGPCGGGRAAGGGDRPLRGGGGGAAQRRLGGGAAAGAGRGAGGGDRRRDGGEERGRADAGAGGARRTIRRCWPGGWTGRWRCR